MKIYVSGPISGYLDGNVGSFRSAAELLVALGHEPVVPHDVPPFAHYNACPRGYASPANQALGHSSNACFLRGDLAALLDCDAIYLLRAWERSVGARAEFDVAAISGLEIYYEDAPVPEIA